ncbi:MAG: hypothetical protein EOR30_17785 [Mesorhizobium sp.]|uniref:Spy/CpxP family protein refolding chaperone n=1 Tax=unclassified Mesorhizobium TaxID=325217 RepID=UPI000FC9D517|nr:MULTISPECIES: Spy/CpxP family protein refolding chaperone [unclassified Mesorhizobium]RUV73210.1 hypothetical protein EOA78_12425 [Mesorhizobium sp. M5C.F.Cr.IN.023.01.1.1]RWF86633.1 MAG: hypothetical protein EOQ36_16350 [Mesorhizobium sp.]RWF95406.1 MAG: hypothetical protein EOQ45_08850 [Mesorhizobium sp.]RWI39756.1 MAG: hypothetical protein EOR14_16800 [Mesorhizobium sp.]RWI45377.1 MAG: hypothetical protein EOR15_23240 [Mesorhizobium sp.]
MTRLSRTIFATAMILIPAAGFAEDAHHPAGTPAKPSAEEIAPAPQANAPGGAMMGGMMPGMMSGDMMRMMMGMMGGGMMGGAQPMAGPMGQMMSPEHVEGRIAFLRTELKVTEAQGTLWQAVADAMRANAGAAKGMMPGMAGGMMPGANMQGGAMPSDAGPVSPLRRIELQEKVLSARLDGLRRLKTALEPFYATLDDAQKAVADKLLVPAPMGMM